MDTVRRNGPAITETRSGETAGRVSTRRPWLPVASYVALATVMLIAAAGFAVWAVTVPEKRAVEIIIPPPAPLTVHVDGAVANPGVYTLPSGSRAEDAIAAAGGLTADSPLNMAMPLSDGQQLVIPITQPTQEPAGVGQGLVDLNTATQEELETLPGIGPSRAAAIIEFRDRNGPIQFLEDLLLVSGIGPATIESLRPLVSQQ